MNAGSLLQRLLLRRSGHVLLALLTTGTLVWTGCVDRSSGLGGSYSTILSLRAVLSPVSHQQQQNQIDEWRVQVMRTTEGVIADASGVVNQGQQTVQVPQLSVTLKSECESLRIRIELLSLGTLWWVAETDHQVCATANNDVGVHEADWIWADPPQVGVSTGSLYFTVPQQSQESQTFNVTYTGDGALSWDLRIEEGNLGWLTVAPTSGTVSAASPQPVTVSVDATGMAVGSHYANLVIEGSSGPPQAVLVEMMVAQGPSIGLSPGELSFEADQGTSPPAQTFTVTNQGAGTLNWSASEDTNWLSLSTTSGSLGAGQSEAVRVTLATTHLLAGEHQATITVTDPDADNSPQTTAVTLIVAEPDPVLVRSPSSMTFNAVQGGSNPVNQTLQISNGGGGTLSWGVSETVGWLSLAPTSGTSTGETDNVTVSVNIAGLSVGTYNTTITETGAAPATGSPQTTAVTLIVAEPDPVLVRSPATMTFNAVEGGSNPATQTLQISNGGGGTLSWGVSETVGWLSLAPTSGTSTGETDNVTVSVNIAGLSAGTYNALITVNGNAINAPVTVPVTLTVTAAPLIGTSPSNFNFTGQQGGPDPASQTLGIANIGGGTLNWSASENTTWLSLAPGGGSSTGETDNVAVSVNTAGLSTGTYTTTITVTGNAPNSPVELPCTLTVTLGPQIGVNPSSLNFTGEEGGANPANRTLGVFNDGGGMLTWNVSDNATWLSLAPASGSSTGETDNVTVSVNTAGLADGTYNATITVTGNAPNSPVNVPVTLTVTAGPLLVRSPSSMTFNAVQGGSNPVNQTLQISNGGGGTLSWGVSETVGWLSLAPTSGTSTGETDNVTVSVNIAGLSVGTYNTTITETGAAPATGSPQTTAVTLIVAEPDPVLVRSPATMTFNAVEGGSNPATQTLQISNGGGGTLSWGVSETVGWLSLAPTSGTSTGETDNVTVSVNIAGLSAGTYNATITETGAAPATGSPQTTAVTLIVAEPDPVLVRSPATMTFNAVQGGSNPVNQTLQISNGGGGTLNWSVSDNGAWLSLSPTSGTATGETDNVTVSVNIAGLSAGTYNATITETGAPPATGSPQTTAVTLVVGPPITSGPMLFTSGTTGNNEIWVRNASGTSLTQLTNTGGSTANWDAEWSPNGARIIFSSYRNGLNDHVWIMDADGSNQTALTTNSVQNVYPSWSPDGSKIVFSSGTGIGREVWVMNADGSLPTELTSNGAEDSQADWSPDGSQIAFFSARSGTWQIWRMNANGSNQTRLTFSGSNDFFPTWSPDGSKIAFVSDRNGNYEIYVMNADGSNQTRLTNTSATELQPSWSPDGTKIVFSSDRDGQSEIYIMDADGSNQTRLTTIAGGNQFPNIGS